MENGTPHPLTFDVPPTGEIVGIASDGTYIVCFETRNRWVPFPKVSYLYFGTIKIPPLNPHGYPDLILLPSSAFPRNDGNSVFHSIAANRSAISKYVSFGITANENEVWVSLASEVGQWQKMIAGLPRAIRCSDLMFAESEDFGHLMLSSYGRGVWRMNF